MTKRLANLSSKQWNIIILLLGAGILVEFGLLLMPRNNPQPSEQAATASNLAPATASLPVAMAAPAETTPPTTPPAATGGYSDQGPTAAPAATVAPTAKSDTYAKTKYGASVEGRDITLIRYGDGPDVTLIMGGFHGDEPGSTAVCRELNAYLSSHPEVYAGRTVLLVPAVNPDGLKAHTRVNAHRVDINRNWEEGWAPAKKGEHSHGEAPMSEPEVQTIAKLIAERHPDKVINLHQKMNMLNPTGSGGIALAKEMATHNHLKVDTSVGYATPGSFGDYCGKRLGLAMVTYELPGGANPWRSARAALLAAIAFKVPMR